MCEKCKKYYDRNGKEITTEQGITNILLKKYGSIENAYLQENNCKKPICECGEELKFESFKTGYRKQCKKCARKKSNSLINDSQYETRQFKYNDFILFYYKNINLYPHHKTKETGVIEPFTGRNTLAYTLFGYVKKYFGSVYFPDGQITCVECKQQSKISFFAQEFICGSKKCSADRQHKEKRIQREQANWDNRNKNYDYVCKITGKLFNIPPHSDVFKKHLLNLNISFIDYVNLYEQENIKRCLYCNIKIPVESNANPSKLYIGKAKFCCHNHYAKYQKENPGVIQSLDSVEVREQKSISLKEKIKNGSFKPKNNKWTNWTAFDSLTNKKYRSRWELIWHLAYPYLNYENIRIPYYDSDGEKHIYIIDFEDSKNKILYEIKPISEIDTDKNIRKKEAALKYCLDNGYDYIIITEDKILEAFNKVSKEQLTEDLCKLKKQLQKLLK